MAGRRTTPKHETDTPLTMPGAEAPADESPWTPPGVTITPANSAPHIYSAMRRVMRDVGPLDLDANGPEVHGGYAYSSYGQILAKLRHWFVTHGIVVESRVLSARSDVTFAPSPPAVLRDGVEITDETKPLPINDAEGERIMLQREEGPDVRTATTHKRTEKGGGERIGWNGKVPSSRTQALVTVQYDFISVFDGSRMTSIGVGESADTGDKAIRKATTSAHKEALIQTFHLDSNEPDLDGTDIEAEQQADANRRAAQSQTRASQNIAAARGAAIDPTPTETSSAPTDTQAHERSQGNGKVEATAGPAVEEKPTGRTSPRSRAKAAEKAEAKDETPKAAEPEAPKQEEAPAPAVEQEKPAEAAPSSDEPTINDARLAFRAAVAKAADEQRPLTPAQQDEIAAQVTGGKTRQQWTKSAAEMMAVANAIATGEVPA